MFKMNIVTVILLITMIALLDAAHLRITKETKAEFHKSAHGQDLWVVHHVLPYLPDHHHTFVEAGVNDGLRGSNAYALENIYNWKGVCIEPNPELFQEAQVNRPKCKLILMCTKSLEDFISS